MTSTICLVSCVGQKQSKATKASDIYISDWFRKAKTYIETVGGSWFILSAKYGLVHPDTIIKPYEKTLNTMKISDRRDWADMVIKQMDKSLPSVDKVIILAGVRYREYLLDYLKHRAKSVEIPMDGLRIGEQLSWLDRKVRN